MKRYIAIINGPNLNLLGSRQPEIYGTATLDDIIAGLRARFPEIEIRHSQHNAEGDIIDSIQTAGYDPACGGIVLNAGALSHYSLAIADALLAVKAAAVEVHLSNIYAREPERRKSVISHACRGVIAGFGADSYRLAIEALMNV